MHQMLNCFSKFGRYQFRYFNQYSSLTPLMCDEKNCYSCSYYWRKGLSATAAVKEICSIEGDRVMSKTTTVNWFNRFQSGDNSLHDKPRSGRRSSSPIDILE